MKFQRRNENVSLISYTIKLVDDSTFLTETLVVAETFLDNLTKIYDRKKHIKYGTEWLIYHFNITKPHFEKVIRNGGT